METNYIAASQTVNHSWYKSKGLILLAIAIALSPSFGIGTIVDTQGVSRVIEIRAEDILLVSLGFLWIGQMIISGTRSFQLPPLFLPIAAWLCFGFLSLLLNVILGNIPLMRSLFFFLKEVEFFFLYLYVFSHVKDLSVAKLILKVWILLGVINATWVLLQTVTGAKLTFYYGPTIFAEPDNPFGSGVFFLTSFLFFVSMFLYYYAQFSPSPFWRRISLVCVLMLGASVLASGSITAFGGLLFGSWMALLLYFMKGRAQKLLLFTSVSLVCLFILFLLVRPPGIQRQLTIRGHAESEFGLEFDRSRANIWKSYINETLQNPVAPYIGLGKSVFGESHNQFVRNFVETGIIGSIIFLFLIFAIVHKGLRGFLHGRDPFLVGASAGFVTMTLTMLVVSIPAESFIYAIKISEVYWFLVGVSMAVLRLSSHRGGNLL